LNIPGLIRKIRRQWLSGHSWLVLLLGSLLIAGLWAHVRYQIEEDYNRTIAENFQETMNLSKAFEEHVRRVVTDADRELNILKRAYELGGLTSPVFADFAQNTVEDPSRNLVAFHDEQGMVIHSSNPNLLAAMRSDRDYFKVHRDFASPNLYIGQTIIGRIEGQSLIPLTRRINKPDGSFGGIVYIGLKTNYFLEFYNKIDLGKDQLISLSGMDGFNRARRVGENFATGQDLRGSEFWRNIQAGRSEASFIATNILDGISRITSYRIMPDYPLIVAVGKSSQVALAGYEQRRQAYLTGASMVSLIILVFCFQLIKLTNALVELCQKLEEASSAKSKLLTNMSHELRTPLNAIIGFSKVLKNKAFGPLTSKQDEYVQNVLVSGQHLLSLVNDLLDLGKVEAGKMVLEKTWINTIEVCQDSVSLFFDKAANRNVQLSFAPDAALEGAAIFADGRRIRQILFNLVDNGIKYNKPGGALTVTVEKTDSGTKSCAIRFVIEDTGIGITEDGLTELFKPFSQLSGNHSKTAEGSGLGLSVMALLLLL